MMYVTTMWRRRGGLHRRPKQKAPTTTGALSRGWHLLPRAVPYLRPYRRFAVLSVLLTIVSAAAALAEPWPLAFIVDTVLAQRPPPELITSLVGDGSGALILFAVGASLLLTLLAGGLMVLNDYLTTSVDLRMVLDFRSDLFRNAQRLSLTFHDDNRTGMLMYRINQQAASLGAIVVALPAFAQSGLTVLGMIYITYRIDPHLAMLAVAVVPFVYYSTTAYANRVEPRLLKVRELEGNNLSIVHEAMAMLRVVVTFGRERHEYRKFRQQGEQAVDARINLTVRQTAFQLLVNFITAVGSVTVLGVGAYQVLRGQITAGELLIVLAYVAAVYTPLEQMTHSMMTMQEQFIGFKHALDLLDTEPEIKEKPAAVSLDRARGEIVFEHVDFSYPARPNTLKDVCFHVPAGSAVAVIGPTGAGKSTLASLLPRLYDVTDGCIRLDGHDLRDLALESLRDQFSIVLQEPLLFSGSIAENIAYGRPGCSQDEIETAAQAANAHEFIMRLPQKYETPLGERGAKISGGERQRIAVARAFLRDAPILILDEPTSSIDSRTEGVILEALERLMVGRTTLMIAHRLSTVRRADKILVLNRGELVEQGTHDELVADGGLYRQLWQAQQMHDDRVMSEQHADAEDVEEAMIEELATDPVAAAARVSPAPAVPARAAPARDGPQPLPPFAHRASSGRLNGFGRHAEAAFTGARRLQLLARQTWNRARADAPPAAGSERPAGATTRSAHDKVRSG
jgi:ATP-binding cassette subfamily B protein